jgi:hypothetical protein
MKIRVSLTVNKADYPLYEWLDKIPVRYRSVMVRLALINAISNGELNVNTYFPNGDIRNDEKDTPTKTVERVSAEAPKATVREPPKGSPPEKPAERPTAQKGEDLLAFTLANLPKGCTPDLRDCAEKFPRAVPYTLDDLVSLKGMLKMLDEPPPQTGQN